MCFQLPFRTIWGYNKCKMMPGDDDMRILVVEDEKLLADSIAALLRNKGFEVETAYDGETGEEMCIRDRLYTALTKKSADKPIAIVMDTVKGKGIQEIEETFGNHSMTVKPETGDKWIAQLKSELEALA